MKQAMTTKQANEQYECQECQSGTPCGLECVESSTCSLACSCCGERVWFRGDLKDTPRKFECPYCKGLQASSYALTKLHCFYCGKKMADLTHGKGTFGNFYCRNKKCNAHYWQGTWYSRKEWEKWIND